MSMTRRSLLATTALTTTALTGAAVGATGGVAGADPGGRPPRGGFVTVHNGSFWLDGARFRFGGTNCYYLHQQSHYMIDAVLDDAAAMGLPVVRAWAFADGTGAGALQPEPGVYDSAAFDSLDYAV